MKARTKAAMLRLAYAVPATPWPVVFWFQSMPIWPGGAHGGANALAGINGAILPMLGATNTIGFLFCLLGLRSWVDVAAWSLTALVHFLFLFGYIAANIFWYA